MSAGLRQLAEELTGWASTGDWARHRALVGSYRTAANPQAVLALLDERDDLDESLTQAAQSMSDLGTELNEALDERGALAARVAAAEALHTPERRYQPHPDAEWSVSRPEDCEDEYGDVVTDPHVFEVCAECGRMEMLSDQHDPGDECPHAYQDSLWPCATIKALGAAGDEDRA